MEQPKFPADFVRLHCPKVLEARSWRQVYKVEGADEDDTAFAECAFYPAGAGLKCEGCRLHLTRPFLGHEVDEEWLPRIEEYYRQLEAWQQWQAQQSPAAAPGQMSCEEATLVVEDHLKWLEENSRSTVASAIRWLMYYAGCQVGQQHAAGVAKQADAADL